MMDDDERKRRLAELQKATRERLRAGCARVDRLEETSSSADLEKWIAGEIRRYGGRAPDLEES